MRTKTKITALIVACLMLVLQLPLSAIAAETSAEPYITPEVLREAKVGQKWSAYFEVKNVDADTKVYFEFGNYVGEKFVEFEWPDGMGKTDGNYGLPYIQYNGVPTSAGQYSFVLNVVSQGKRELLATKNYTLTIKEADPLGIRADYCQNAVIGENYTVLELHVENSEFASTWYVAEGSSLPEGLELVTDKYGDASIKGNPTKAGKYTCKIGLKCGEGANEQTTTKDVNIIVEPEGGCKHENKTKIERKDATCRENGMVDYYFCEYCEYNFLDEACKYKVEKDLNKLYTTSFHTDKNKDKKCDFCGKNMPIFKKITDEKEITSCGMYLVVSKIGDKYYTFKSPEDYGLNYYKNEIEAYEITPNSDGTFSYIEPEEAITVKTTHSAECGNLDAGLPRYNLSTVINNIPYSFEDDGYGIMFDSYSDGKYGYRLKLNEDKSVTIASVYDAYWNPSSGGKGEENSIFAAFEGTKDSVTKQFFSIKPKNRYVEDEIYAEEELIAYPIELYKLTYAGTTDTGKDYTLSDAQSMVTIGNEFTVVSSSEGKELSTVGGISEALKSDYVETAINSKGIEDSEVSVRAFANINLTNEDSVEDDYGMSIINSLTYSVTPQLEIKGASSETAAIENISDENLDGSQITMSLFIGNMHPKQIIHYKADGTKEYFYDKNSEYAKNGAKTFEYQADSKGNFVTFSVNSFSDIEILATPKAEEHGKITYEEGKLNANVDKAGTYALVLANYSDSQLTATKVLMPTLTKGNNAINDIGDFELTAGSKVYLWDNFDELTPICEALVISE